VVDLFFAAALGCEPRALRAGRPVVVESYLDSVWFAKSRPLAVYGLITTEGAVVAVRPGLGKIVRETLRGVTILDEAGLAALKQAVSPAVRAPCWFEGIRLVCEPGSVEKCAAPGRAPTAGEVREVSPAEEAQAAAFYREWGGKVFGWVIDRRVVSWAAVKPLSEVVWDLSVETLPDYRDRGYAKSVVRAALHHIFSQGKLAGWGCDRDNLASLAVARGVGFRDYGLDFGCVEEPGDPQSGTGRDLVGRYLGGDRRGTRGLV